MCYIQGGQRVPPELEHGRQPALLPVAEQAQEGHVYTIIILMFHYSMCIHIYIYIYIYMLSLY